ncbi:MAG: UbiA family prenyltransferase [Bacteroidia bacterium]|nr:UbiA family prenyltransferase [Bacteroidia bacterium]NNJ55480.1 prenyltransferase [Bacteroidia bacterium]
MPVFLFALSQSFHIQRFEALLTFILLHLIIYPSSNAYNSYHDQDQNSIGGLKKPPAINKKVLLLANILDFFALSVSIFLGLEFFLLVLAYISASRLYSNRKIRLKKYPYIGFIVIFFFQGAFTYYLASVGIGQYWGSQTSSLGWKSYTSFFNHHSFALLACSFQIGAIYPLTQIYQHRSDFTDNVTTISYKLGYIGTFIFSGMMFSLATLFYYFHFKDSDIYSFYILIIVQLPIISYFLYWFSLVLKDTVNANYKHTMRMSTISAVVLNLFFLYLVINK